MLVLLLFISFTFANIGEAVIEGTVGSTEDGTPLTGANVVLFESNKNRYGATTDGSGFFRIENVESGTYNINIIFIGFDDYREDVYIEKGKQYKIDVSLMIQPIKMTSLEIISDAIMPYDNLPGSATVMDIKTINADISIFPSLESNANINCTNRNNIKTKNSKNTEPTRILNLSQ